MYFSEKKRKKIICVNSLPRPYVVLVWSWFIVTSTQDPKSTLFLALTGSDPHSVSVSGGFSLMDAGEKKNYVPKPKCIIVPLPPFTDENVVYTFRPQQKDRLIRRWHFEICLIWILNRVQYKVLTHLPLDKMAVILQTTFSIAFSWLKCLVFLFEFHRSLFLRVQLTKSEISLHEAILAQFSDAHIWHIFQSKNAMVNSKRDWYGGNFY